MSKRWRRWAICASLALVSAVGARLLSNFRFFELLNLKSLDAQFLLRGTIPAPNVMLVLADQKALDTFSDLRLFWHPYYADAIRAAGEGGAKVIGLDVAFGVPVEKYQPDYDRELSEAVIDSPVPVVTGYVDAFNGNEEARKVPLNLLSASLGLSGFSNLTVDPADDFVRRQELIEAEPSRPSDPPPAHSFALRVAEKYLGAEAQFEGGKLTLAGHPIPITPASSDSPRSIVIRDVNPPVTPNDKTPHVSLADVYDVVHSNQTAALKHAALKQWFDGKIVLIGSDFVDDRYATPFYTMAAGPKWLTPGVEIQAGVIRTILDKRYLISVPEFWRMLALLAAAGLSGALVTGLPAWPAAAWIAVEILAILGFTQLLFRGGLILSTSEMAVAAAGSWALTVVYRLLTAEQRGNLFHRAFSLFVGADAARTLDDTAQIGLSGKRADVTIMFTDIRGFTAYTEEVSQERGPEVVVATLNEYLAQMVAIIVKHHGRVNKFIGDGILAIFSDQDEEPNPGDHPLRAVRCALEIVTAPSRFETGSGLHTGLAVTGNVGSADKMEYTVLGDTVNLASRLESLNKENHSRLLMTEATQSRLGGAVETTCLGATPVRGKSAPVKIYTVTSLLPAAFHPGAPAAVSKALTNA